MGKRKRKPSILDNEFIRLKRVICVDPGVMGTGLAFFDNLIKPIEVPIQPSEVWQIEPKKNIHWKEKVLYIEKEFKKILNLWKPETFVLESQELWTESAKSMASGGSGDIFKTSFLTGFLSSTSLRWYKQNYRIMSPLRLLRSLILLSPGQWKGQMSKITVDKRIKRSLDRLYADHVSDAVGIGLAIQDHL